MIPSILGSQPRVTLSWRVPERTGPMTGYRRHFEGHLLLLLAVQTRTRSTGRRPLSVSLEGRFQNRDCEFGHAPSKLTRRCHRCFEPGPLSAAPFDEQALPGFGASGWQSWGPERALIAREGLVRRRALKICALATGLADKAVILIYERVLHDQSSPVWVGRCRMQIEAVLQALEADRRSNGGASWWGERIGHADIAVACACGSFGKRTPNASMLRAGRSLRVIALVAKPSTPSRP